MNEVDVCNQALSQLGVNNIQALTEATKEARQCKLFYPISRDTVLESHDWGFARKRLVLALSTEVVTDWDYVYQYPSDCLKARKILDETGASTGTIFDLEVGQYKPTGTVEFEVATVGGSQVVLTNKADAELVYTAKITDANLFSSAFVSALSYYIASNLAIPLKGKPEIQQLFMRQYMLQVASAKAEDANQGNKKPDDTSDFARARY
jgi:hypothetical protein